YQPPVGVTISKVQGDSIPVNSWHLLQITTYGGSSMEHVRSKKKLTPPIIAGIVAGAAVLVLAGAYCGLCAWVSGNGRLLPGTIAQNHTQTVTLDLGGLTQDAAVEYMTSSMK